MKIQRGLILSDFGYMVQAERVAVYGHYNAALVKSESRAPFADEIFIPEEELGKAMEALYKALKEDRQS